MTSQESTTSPAFPVRDMTKAIHINLPITETEDDIKALTRNYHGKSEIYLAKDKNTKEFRGLAYVFFRTRKNAEAAVEGLNGLNYKNTVLKASLVTPE